MERNKQPLSFSDMLKLREQIKNDQMMRDMGIAPSIIQYDVPRETPGINNINSPRDDYYAEKFGPLAGLLSRNLDSAVKSVPGAAYSLAGGDLAEDASNNIYEGIRDGSASRVAGGAAELGLAALPLAGKAASAAYKTIPRAVGLGGAYTVSPLVASGVLTPDDAQANDMSSILDFYSDKLGENGKQIGAGLLASVMTAPLVKGGLKGRAVKAQEMIDDINIINRNNRTADVAKSAIPDERFHMAVDDDLASITPSVYSPKTDIELRHMLDKAERKANDIFDIDSDTALIAGGIGGATGAMLSEDSPYTDGAISGALGGLFGYMMPPAKLGDRVRNQKSSIKKYDINKTLSRFPDAPEPKQKQPQKITPEYVKDRSGFAIKPNIERTFKRELDEIKREIGNAKNKIKRPRHHAERRDAVIDGLAEGRGIKEMSRLHNVPERTVRNWNKIRLTNQSKKDK